MLANKLKRAGAGAGGALYVDDLFSTYLYTGNGSTQTITNGIDLAGEGGLVWIKDRSVARSNLVFDSERVVSYPQFLITDTTSGEVNAQRVSSFNETGFTLINSVSANAPTENYTSWTFRKAPKFFDVVTYVGDGAINRELSHSLDSIPGCIMIKRTDVASNWFVYHRADTLNGGKLNLTDSFSGYQYINAGLTNDSVFTLYYNSVVNASGGTYVAYLFAHNDGDGEFGENGDEDIIKCGSYVGGGTGVKVDVNLGFEPQYLLVKCSSDADNWFVLDAMRGVVVGGNDSALQPNTSNAESSAQYAEFNSTGFNTSTSTNINVSGRTYIYIAIRRPHKPAESGSEVFAIDQGDRSFPDFDSAFPVDLGIVKNKDVVNNWNVGSRLTQGSRLKLNLPDAEDALSAFRFDSNTGWADSGFGSANYSWMFKRSKGFFDVVCYTGDGIAGRTVNHNLGVVPELMIVKNREDSGGQPWMVWHSGLAVNEVVRLNENWAKIADNGMFNSTSPTSEVFAVGTYNATNGNTHSMIAYLFASQAGISKVGSFTGNGTSQTIDCGFSTGSRFVLIKRTDSTGDWHLWDSVRGIVAGNDPHLSLNTTAAEVTTDDSVDPDASGFIVNQVAATNINVNSASYIFLSIA